MNIESPVHSLLAKLEGARLHAIETLASDDEILKQDALRTLVIVQAALTAVKEEIQAHGAHRGWGAEVPLR